MRERKGFQPVQLESSRTTKMEVADNVERSKTPQSVGRQLCEEAEERNKVSKTRRLRDLVARFQVLSPVRHNRRILYYRLAVISDHASSDPRVGEAVAVRVNTNTTILT